jgi:hypothetical protein
MEPRPAKRKEIPNSTAPAVDVAVAVAADDMLLVVEVVSNTGYIFLFLSRIDN